MTICLVVPGMEKEDFGKCFDDDGMARLAPTAMVATQKLRRTSWKSGTSPKAAQACTRSSELWWSGVELCMATRFLCGAVGRRLLQAGLCAKGVCHSLFSFYLLCILSLLCVCVCVRARACVCVCVGDSMRGVRQAWNVALWRRRRSHERE